MNFTAYFLSWELFELQKRMIPLHQWYSMHRFHFISDTLYITVGNRDYTCTNTFSPEQSQVMLKTFWNPKHANTLYFQSTEMHSTQQFWVMNQKHFKTGCFVLDYYLGMGFCLSKNNIIFSLSILSNYHSSIISHFQWTL